MDIRIDNTASAFTAVSDGLAGDAAHEMNLPREKIRTIYNPVAVPASPSAGNGQPSGNAPPASTKALWAAD